MVTGTGTRKRLTAEHRTAPRERICTATAQRTLDRGADVHRPQPDSRWRPRRCRSAVSFAWRTTGDGSLAMVLLDGTYAAAATAAERAPFTAGAEVLIALDDGRDRVPQTLGILSVSLLILGDVSNGACVAGRGDRRDRGRPAGAPARVRLGTRALRRAAARLADRHRLCALDARGAGAAQSPTGGCRSDRTCATAGWTPRSLPAGRPGAPGLNLALLCWACDGRGVVSPGGRR